MKDIWKILKSVKLAVFLLIILAIASTLGTIIPQGEEAIWFAMKRPELFKILHFLGLFDLYHTLWFRAILGLLALNLIVCSVDRLPDTWKRIKEVKEPKKEEFRIKVKEDFSEVRKKIEVHLRCRLLKEQKDKVCFFIEKGRFSCFGVYIVHFSIILILLGGIIGSIFGFEGYMSILEGEKKDTVRLKNKKELKLDFQVRCDKFLVEFYENGMPKEYISFLTFIKGGKEFRKTLKVNHPVRFDGITFYQASYGIAVGDSVLIKVLDKTTKKEKKVKISLGEEVSVFGIRIKLLDIREDFGGAGPAVFLKLKKDGEKRKLILFRERKKAERILPSEMLNSPIFDPSFFNYSFSVESLETKYYTGLQVSKNPGVPVVWTGFFFISFGLILTFFSSHRRIWIYVRKKEDGTEIAISGMSNRKDKGFLENIKENISRICITQ